MAPSNLSTPNVMQDVMNPSSGGRAFLPGKIPPNRSAALLLPVPISCCAQGMGQGGRTALPLLGAWGLQVGAVPLLPSSPIPVHRGGIVCPAPAWQCPAGSWGCTPKLGAPVATTVLNFDCLPLLPSFARVIITLSMKSWAC